jgi:hypothetical protein
MADEHDQQQQEQVDGEGIQAPPTSEPEGDDLQGLDPIETETVTANRDPEDAGLVAIPIESEDRGEPR